ncbi:MAG: YHS domain-containing protein [Gammaproteobacteria bacterium]|nr:YHS domain-containing protein [Gammaproteobacteria bacterium]MBU1979168.1 YHS domain-containing protein [Gammaproteobacteria bacterium]
MDNSHRIDPVCGMEVTAHQNETVYLGIHYAFCSQQCLDSFTAHPHLYVGFPGRKAPKLDGMEVLKRRRLHLSPALSTDQALLLNDTLVAMMGVKKVLAEGDRVELTYDLLQVTVEQIEAKIAEIGIRLGEGWSERLRLAFIHYQEECEVGNLEVQERHVHGSGH